MSGTVASVYATDVDEEALATARHGLYRVEDVKDAPPTLLELQQRILARFPTPCRRP